MARSTLAQLIPAGAGANRKRHAASGSADVPSASSSTGALQVALLVVLAQGSLLSESLSVVASVPWAVVHRPLGTPALISCQIGIPLEPDVLYKLPQRHLFRMTKETEAIA